MRLAGNKYRNAEADLLQRIAAVETRLKEVLRISGVRRVDKLPNNVRMQVENLQKGLLQPRRELRRIRQKMRARAISLGRWIAFINLLAAPLIVLVLALAAYHYRNRRRTIS